MSQQHPRAGTLEHTLKLMQNTPHPDGAESLIKAIGKPYEFESFVLLFIEEACQLQPNGTFHGTARIYQQDGTLGTPFVAELPIGTTHWCWVA